MYQSDLNQKNKALQDKLQTLYGLSRGKKMSDGFTDAYLNLLDAFGNPHLKLPPVIHVAGTNGKGSTIAFLKAILEASGRSVHTYTSPHLHEFNERIVLNGEPITDDVLSDLIDEVISLNNGADITFFEITTAMAFAAFSRQPADVVLLETGMGGRLDCTNVIQSPLATIITPISMDHTEFLGDAIESIAFEKAGIMKPDTACIVAPQMYGETLSVLKKHADHIGAPLMRYGSEWFVQMYDNHFVCDFQNGSVTCPMPDLQGIHQIQNVASAIAVLRFISSFSDVSEDHIASGVRRASWAGRMQDVSHLFDIQQGSQWRIIYDGGHNAAAGHVISSHIQTMRQSDANGSMESTHESVDESVLVHLVLGMMAHKDVRGFCDPILPYANSVSAVDMSDEPAAMTAHAIKDALVGHDVQTYSDVRHAVQLIMKNHNGGVIVIAGSFYLAQYLKPPVPIQSD